MKLRRVTIEVYVPTVTCAGCGIEAAYSPRQLHVKHGESPWPTPEVPVGAFMDMRDCAVPPGWAEVGVQRGTHYVRRRYCADCQVPGGEPT